MGCGTSRWRGGTSGVYRCWAPARGRSGRSARATSRSEAAAERGRVVDGERGEAGARLGCDGGCDGGSVCRLRAPHITACMLCPPPRYPLSPQVCGDATAWGDGVVPVPSGEPRGQPPAARSVWRRAAANVVAAAAMLFPALRPSCQCLINSAVPCASPPAAHLEGALQLTLDGCYHSPLGAAEGRGLESVEASSGGWVGCGWRGGYC